MIRAGHFSLIVFAAFIATACGDPLRDEALTTVRIYDLLVALPRATAHVHNSRYLQIGEFGVRKETRQALYLHPSGSVEFPAVHLSSRAVLAFRIGIDQAAWDQPGDGVEFTAFVSRANDARTKVFTRYLDPKHNLDDRGWIEGRISLKAFHDQDVQIILATGPGPANDFNYDWALWAEPRIILGDDPLHEIDE